MKIRSALLSAAAVALTLGLGAASTAQAEDSGFKIMMTPKWTGFPYFEAAARGGEAAAEELGDEFVYAGADHADVTLQVETLQNFLTQRPDAILLAAIDLNAVAPVLKEAMEQGIVVTTFDADAAADARDMFVNQMSYKQAAKTMLDCALIDAPEGGEVAFVAASPTSPNHSAHIKFMKEYIETDPTYQVFTVVDTQYANDDDAKSYDVAINLMQAHPNLKVIISSSAVSAPAGARAIAAAGRAGEVYSTGFALPDAIKSYLEDGSQKCFALWNPYELGYLATYVTHLKLAGKLELTPGTTFEAGKAGSYTVGEGGEIVYGKPMMFTKDTVDDAGF
ncbi:substrate-binding domain-containing protein [Bauldia litoralis]|uniref:Monosaccharide ABC transporter substrate-binding protein, CUT2 family (TC 3.A.1.2.-) n=1 Tax=Bauldia litoralis TaxID=665467 RepID=A0A1G6DYA3_9HYPH|nr:substrate-binding domain-containing protein [Bauldia litoralis]SDB50092.1 monosaccharide ABC transporter substrate-binding protein, CUT2 family (TC 3.A.1.2.-) [Bauldia litoralis]